MDLNVPYDTPYRAAPFLIFLKVFSVTSERNKIILKNDQQLGLKCHKNKKYNN